MDEILDLLESVSEGFATHSCIPIRQFCRTNRDTVKILKFGTPQTIAIIVIEIEKFDVTLH